MKSLFLSSPLAKNVRLSSETFCHVLHFLTFSTFELCKSTPAAVIQSLHGVQYFN